MTTKKKKTATKATKKAATKPLRTPQIRLLEALAKAKAPLARAELSAKAKVDGAWVGTFAGSLDAKVRKQNDAINGPSLVARGFARVAEADGVSVWTITAKGRAALKASKGGAK